MEKKLSTLLTLLLLTSFVVAPATFAQNDNSNDVTEVEVMMKDKDEDSTTMTLEERKTKREEAREEAKEKREELKAEIKEKREDAKALMKEKREEFQAKLEDIKDEKKAAIVERVDTRLSERNERITDRLLGHLERISAIIDKMEDKLANAKGGDTSDVEDAIATARTAVASAESAVVAQSGKTYVIDLGEEDELRTVVKTTLAEFRADMKVAIDAVKVARDATREVAQALSIFREANLPK